MTAGTPSRIEQEAARLVALSEEMISAYGAWGSRVAYGETYNMLYADIIDFVNFRIETTMSCLTLINAGRIADALGLARSLLEHYLLFILMCRGDRYFQLQDLTRLSSADYHEQLATQIAAWEKEVAEGKTNCIEVRGYPRARRHIMYVYEGLRAEGSGEFTIPLHYFEFQEFRPETMRLDQQDYFEYYDRSPELKKALKEHRRDAHYQYQHYLSYDALIECLDLNGIADAAIQHRIEAHYTFLGTFLHPTHNSARRLHEQPNVHAGSAQVGMGGRYTATARLLASLYAVKLLAGIVSELCGLFERAPSEFVRDAGTGDLRELTAEAESATRYFWFIFNDAPLYDRFNWAVHHASDDLLTEVGNYADVPSKNVPFNQHILKSLEDALRGWTNPRIGRYVPPL